MQGVDRIDLLGGYRRPFGKFPEEFSVFCLGVEGVGIQQLHDVVSEQLKEQSSGHLNRIIKVCWPILEQFSAFFEHLDVRNSKGGLLAFFKQLSQSLGIQTEFLTEQIPGPLYAVQGLLREHLESAMRNVAGSIIGVLHVAVGLGLVG